MTDKNLEQLIALVLSNRISTAKVLNIDGSSGGKHLRQSAHRLASNRDARNQPNPQRHINGGQSDIYEKGRVISANPQEIQIVSERIHNE
jgi:hypothetical protein